ncbi:MAG: putative lipid II flippase FtsW [Propionibacteriaceae bacterium]|jgi:cell division protein FtsW|nr:putative lipid II flippase FtsW [Propionibacteriaceae bacterium]
MSAGSIEPRAIDLTGNAAPAATSGKVASAIREALTRPLASYYIVLASSALLAALGLLMVTSASSVWSAYDTGDPYSYARSHVFYLAIGVGLAFVLSRCNETLLWLAGMAGYVLAGVLLAMVVFTPFGMEYYGNRSWLDLPLVPQFQPSELAKVALVLWCASFISSRERSLGDLGKWLPQVVLFSGALFVLVAAEKDYGSALVFAGIIVALLWFTGLPAKYMAVLSGAGVAAAVALVLLVPSKMGRVVDWLAGFVPGVQSVGVVSDQPLNAIYALASGGWWGRGLGASVQKWGGLKNGAQTDYVFAVIGEELGLFGTLIVMVLFFALIWAGLRIAGRSDRVFFRILAAGISGWLGIQAMINIFVALRLLPVVGITLPFISYGGSSLISCMLAVGLLLAAARNEPEARRVLGKVSKKTPTRVVGIVSAPAPAQAATGARDTMHLVPGSAKR